MTEPGQNKSPNVAIGPNNTTRHIPESVARRVWIAAGGRCTFCNRWLLDDETTGQQVAIGQLAHVVGWDTSAGSPRGADPLPIANRNGADNLMLLCYDQHHVIDSKSLWTVYDADRLRALKRQHEYRIKQLTSLAQSESTTVLRLVGTIHGRHVQLAPSAVNKALVEVGRFPSYVLQGADEYEIDLRKIPGESDGSTLHWSTAVAFIEERLRLLKSLVADGTVVDLAVFPLARIPILVALGVLLDDTLPTTVYPKRRGGAEEWGWSASGTDQQFRWHEVASGRSEPAQVTVVFSVSGSVEMDRIPREATEGARVYEITPIGATPNFDLVDTPATVDAFARCWRSLIAEIETVSSVASVSLVPAVPATIAVAIGRSINTSVHPPMRVYDRVGHAEEYVFTIEVPR
ncbi:SAVED domain-containing protein [Microbacterium sp. CCH5-D1]|uniref:SAVED domain-containing protein n=1 Tax=Microbacterium sp. CCH5-D1 TaxID=1768780 RepID=UPI000B06F68E|nr:SAVED domain-containing protein [Microbacterium sp. CCH5-D1]